MHFIRSPGHTAYLYQLLASESLLFPEDVLSITTYKIIATRAETFRHAKHWMKRSVAWGCPYDQNSNAVNRSDFTRHKKGNWSFLNCTYHALAK